MERKEFIKKFAVGGSILLTAPVLFNACSDDSTEPDNGGGTNNTIVDLGQTAYSALGTVGGSANKGNIIIIRTGDTSYIALSNVCTHQQCTVGYNHGTTELICPCHGSKYSTSGAVTNGPAPTSLKKYTVTKDGNSLKIS
ncbi:MAG: Rieske (2Fe-2S) protein [Bacteroidetes bacterium]|nr:Rieske (2Fe-2S) protein [Bacteroidota bacterium]